MVCYIDKRVHNEWEHSGWFTRQSKFCSTDCDDGPLTYHNLDLSKKGLDVRLFVGYSYGFFSNIKINYQPQGR